MTDGVQTTPEFVPAPVAPQLPARSSFLQRVGGALFTPGQTMPEIAQRPDITAPLLTILLIVLVIGILFGLKLDFVSMMRETFSNVPNATPDIVEKQARFAAIFARAMAFFAPVTTAISLVIFGAIFLAAFRLMGGDGEFNQAFSITLYAWFPQVIKGIITAIVLLSRKRPPDMYLMQNPVATNPGFFISGKTHPIAFAFLSSLDLFTIWTLVILILGLAAMSRFSRAKSAAIVLSLWAVKVLFSILGGAMQALRMNRA